MAGETIDDDEEEEAIFKPKKIHDYEQEYQAP